MQEVFNINTSVNIMENVKYWTISKTDFRNKFTFDERVLIDNYSESTTLTSEQKSYMNTFTKDIELMTIIDLSSDYIKNYLSKLEEFGLIASNRASEILAY